MFVRDKYNAKLIQTFAEIISKTNSLNITNNFNILPNILNNTIISDNCILQEHICILSLFLYRSNTDIKSYTLN